ncbi:MAG: pyridoxamine 5'-phosphate oxidase family protein [Acidobacteria bacterium]|nr:pyridoxamine 5'-phosphate oxidase family protein [Acidobacteriota bacterium]
MTESNIWIKRISHGEILKLVWKNLDLGTLDRHHPFHLGVFATIDDGEPRTRTVVLRRFWRKPRALAFPTHAGAPKVLQILANPKVSWLFYNPADGLQVRIRGTAEIITDGALHEEQWLATELLSRRCYVGETPSQVSKKPTSGLPESLVDRKPTREESELGKYNFVVVRSTIDEVDCMELDVRGNRRSLFRWNSAGEIESKWLTP